MVHKRFIKKNGKIFGPYFYKSVREGSRVKNIYLGTGKKIKKKEAILAISIIFLALFFFQLTIAQSSISGTNSNLIINDTTDNADKYTSGNYPGKIDTDSNVIFYANYSNSTVGPIMGNCSIRFNISGSTGPYYTMNYSESDKLYLFNRSFNYRGNFSFQVNCTNSTYDGLNITDNFFITNTAPYLTGYLISQENPTLQTCYEDSICTYNFSTNFTDDDFNDLPLSSFSKSSLITFDSQCVSIDSVTGIASIACTSDSQSGGPFNLTVTVQDGDGSSRSLLTKWQIIAVNDAPYFVSTSPLTSATENSAYSNYINIADEEQGSITSGTGALGNFSFTINDTSIFQINRTTGLITNSTALTNALVGTYYLQINITDSALPTNATNSTMFELAIQNYNDQPNITFACDNSLEQTEDVPFSCYINTSDIDVGQTHTYSANYSWFNFTCANEAVINGNTSCLVNFAPNDSAVYSHWINITVTDNDGGIDSIVINFSVTNVPDTPYFSNISNMTAWAFAPFWYQIEATDDDNATQYGETLNYWDNSSLFTIENTTGIISFTPSNAQNGTYWINISVNDSTNNWVTTIINFTININSPPIYNASQHYNMTEGYLFELNLSLNTSDPENNTFTFTDNTSILNITSNGLISFTANDSHVGVNWFDVNITDQYGATSTYMFNFTVANEEDAPVLSTIANVTTASEGNEISFTLQATDPDLLVPDSSEYLRFKMNSSVLGMNLDLETGAFTWTPSATQNGTYWINFTVNDTSDLQDSQVIFINVSDAAFPPRFVDTDGSFCTTRNATEDELFASCTIIACDNDTNAKLRIAANYSWFNSNINTSNITGVFNPAYGYCVNTTLNFTPDYTEVGNYTVQLNVTDITGSFVTFNFTFNITSKNDAPILISIPNLNPVVGRDFSYDVNATDEEGDTLAFFSNDTLSSVGVNATINQTTGIITLTPNSSHTGVYWVNITVNDTSGLQDSQIVRFLVGNNSIPTCSAFFAVTPSKTITSSPDEFNMSENQSTGSFSVTCSDFESDYFTYQWYWNGTLNYSALDPNGNIWNYTASFLQAGNINITLIVNDSVTQSNSYYWNVSIIDINAPPMMYSQIPNITKMPTWLSSSGWYKNRDSSINLSEFFFDYDRENLTYNWYRYAINESFSDNDFSLINNTWNFTGTWSLVNDTTNNPALKQNDTLGLKIASEDTYVNISEVKAKFKIYSGGVAGFCLGDSSCSTTAKKVYLNKTDNTTNFEYLVNSSVNSFDNSYILGISNSSYIWMKSIFNGNNTLIYVSSDGNAWNLTQNITLSTTTSSATFSIFTINAEAIIDDIVLKDPNLKNFTVTYSEEGDKLTFTPNSGWSGDLLMAVTAFDGKNSTDSNIFNLHVDDVSEPEPVVQTVTKTSSSTSRVTQVASLDIVVPSLISLTPLSKTVVPVILQNSGDLDLNILDLIAITNQSALTLNLDEANWTILSAGDSVTTNLDIDIGLLTPDRYTIKLIGNSQTPKLTEEVNIVIDVREKDAVLKAQLKEQIQFTRDLFLQNPECLELWELIEEAESLMSNYEYEKGLDIIHSANQGCKDFISLDSEKLSTEKAKTFFELYWKTISFEVSGLIVAIMLLIYYFKRRRFAKPI